MKKRISSILSLALALMLLAALVPQRAEAAGISFSGAGSLREGERVTVTFSISGSNILAVEANLDYDSSHLTLEDVSQEIGGGWVMDSNGSKIVLRDTTLNDPINSGTSLFSATFRVDSGTEAGTSVWASVDGVVVSDGNSDISLGSASWGADILAPLSGDNYLAYITCSNGTLEPAFSPDIQEYSMTVPYEVDSLGLDWGRNHSGSWVDVSGNSLSVGSNTVSFTVTAENGSTRTYYIYVTREQDPNYVSGTDATLSELIASTGTLSPAFDPAKMEYVVYVPYEVESISINGTANDSKAKGVTQAASDKLQQGDNLLKVVCTAEDGTTTKTYQIHVVRMPAYAGVLPKITGIDSAVPANAKQEPAKAATMEIPLMLTLPLVGEVPTWAVGVAALVLVLLVLFLLAWFWGRHSGKKKILTQLEDDRSEPVPEEDFSFNEEPERTAEESGIEEELDEQAQEACIPALEIPAVQPTVEPEEIQEPMEPLATETPAAEMPVKQEVPAKEMPAESEAAQTPTVEVPVEAVPAAENSAEEEQEISAQIAAKVSAQMDAEKKAAEEAPEKKMTLTELLEDIHNM